MIDEAKKRVLRYIGYGALVVLFGSYGYGLYHDFTPAYEASHPIQYDMVVYDSVGNEITVKDLNHTTRSQNYRILPGGVIMPLTPLDEEGLKIQEEDGCTACHDRK